VFVGHPLDTLKARLQTMDVTLGQPPPFKNAFDCFMQTMKKEGVSRPYSSFHPIEETRTELTHRNMLVLGPLQGRNITVSRCCFSLCDLFWCLW
jgi:hypothetical protein